MLPTLRSPALLALMALLVLAAPGVAQSPPTLPNFDRRTPMVLAVENVGPAVVNLRTLSATHRNGFGFLRGRLRRGDTPEGFEDQSVGSGVIIHPDGYVVTNDHVIHRADRTLAYLADGRKIEARVISTSPDADIAILKLEGEGPFPYALLGNSKDTMVGETTIAMGNPFGLSSSVTSGILSAKERPIPVGPHNESRTVIQTSALINPGNSGGPLCDINGRVIGINVAIDRRGPGIGYAIPIDRVKEVATDLLSPEMSRSLTAGIDLTQDQAGLLVEHIHPQSSAASAGIQRGDRILAVADKPVSTPLEYHLELQRFGEEKKVPLTLVSGGERAVLEVALKPLSMEELLGDSVDALGMSCRNLTRAAVDRLGFSASEARFIGVLVTGVKPGSSAARIGIQKGDVLYQVGNNHMKNVETLKTVADYFMARRNMRNRLAIRIYRPDSGEALQGTLNLNER